MLAGGGSSETRGSPSARRCCAYEPQRRSLTMQSASQPGAASRPTWPVSNKRGTACGQQTCGRGKCPGAAKGAAKGTTKGAGERLLKRVQVPDLPKLPPNARYAFHENNCFDWGTFGWAIQTQHLELSRYKFFVFLNSSVRGPFLPTYLRVRPSPFLRLLDGSVCCATGLCDLMLSAEASCTAKSRCDRHGAWCRGGCTGQTSSSPRSRTQ